MPSPRNILLILLVLAAVPACHTRGPVPGNRPTRWSGSFKANRLNSELGRSAPNSGFGTIMLTPIEGRQTRIEMSINVPVAAGEHVPWAVLSGTCGSAYPMVAGQSEFPTIEINESGNGSVRVDMGFMLDVKGTYHANVYWPNRSRDLNDVMMCAKLDLGG